MNTTFEIQIAEVAANQKAEKWAARQEAARQQQANAERQRAERHRTNRIAQLQAQLKQIPDRIKQAAALSSDSDELAGVWSTQVDGMANAYAQRLHAERQSGRPARLDLASPEAHAFFFGSQIKKSLRQLALTANSRSFGAPLLDVESLAAELRDEEKRLRAELNELQLRG